MKFFKNIFASKASSETSEMPNKIEKSIGQMIKDDFFKTLWLLGYMVVIALITYGLFSALPMFFAYVYTYIGLNIGLDVTSASQTDLVYWQMISLSTGAVFAGLIFIVAKKCFGLVTRKMFVKHILKKSEISNIVKLEAKK
jgi:hypothetical protein